MVFPEPLSAGVSFLDLCRLRFAGVLLLWRRLLLPTFLPLPLTPDFDFPDPSLVEDDDAFELPAVAAPDVPAISIPST